MCIQTVAVGSLANFGILNYAAFKLAANSNSCPELRYASVLWIRLPASRKCRLAPDRLLSSYLLRIFHFCSAASAAVRVRRLV